MRIIARIWLFAWFCGFIMAAMIGAGCDFTVVPPPEPMATDKACPRGLTHDECVQFKYCSKYPKICAAK